MIRRNAQTLQEVMDQVLREQHLDVPLSELRLIEKWPEIVGAPLAAQTEKLYVKDHTLFLHVKSAIVRNELNIMRSKLIGKIGESIGPTIIRNIVLR